LSSQAPLPASALPGNIVEEQNHRGCVNLCSCTWVAPGSFVFLIYSFFSQPQDLDPKAETWSLKRRGTLESASATCHNSLYFRIFWTEKHRNL
jgi:hypothetical protein